MGWRKTVGATIGAVEPGEVTVELEADERHRHDWGMVQGGMITAVADAAMGLSLLTDQPSGELNVTIELKINFVRPMIAGRMRARGRVLGRDGDLLFAEAEVFDGEDRLVAVASSTCVAISGGPLR